MRETKAEGPRSEANGSRSEAETIGKTSPFRAELLAVTKDFIYIVGKAPEVGIPPSYRATRRYTKVHLGFCVRFSTLIGQIGGVPRFGGEPRRYIRSWLFRLAVTSFRRALTASRRQKGKRKQISFLGPLPRQNCLRILRPWHFGTTRSKSCRPLRHTQPWQPTSLSDIQTHRARSNSLPDELET